MLTLDRIIDNVGNRVGNLADGDTTDDTRLALTGTGEAGQIVQIYDGDTLLGTATVADNGYWLFHTPWLDDGKQYAFRAKYAIDTDGAGYTDSYAITVDAPYPLAPTTATFGGNSVGSHKNSSAFAALKDDGSVVTWGNADNGGDSSAEAAQLSSGVVQVFSTRAAFAALKDDGSVVTWGNASGGGNTTTRAAQLTSGVVQVFSTGGAFAALKDDGSVVVWGDINTGSLPRFTTVAAQLTSGVVQVFSHHNAFAALKDDGSVVTWGVASQGGDSTAVAAQLTSGVVQVFGTSASFFVDGAFAALKDDGSVVTWGSARNGGDSTAVAAQLSSGVVQVFSTGTAFAALKDDGSVVTWGGAAFGGNSTAVAAQLTSGVVQVFSTGTAFAALKADGSVVTWGLASEGGDSTAVAAQLTSGVVQVFSNDYAFAALKDNGSVVTWGETSRGGDSTAVAAQLTSSVVQVFSTPSAFAALKDDGSVVTWGDANFGGDSTAVAAQLTSGIVQVFSTGSAFAALKADGTVVTWGNAANGGANNTNADLTGIATISHPRGDTTFTFGTPLDAPTLALAEDTGSDPADGITADATLLVSGLKDGATWEYSVDNGATWQAGTGTSFELPDGTYEAGQVQVRQTLNGKTSPVGSHDAPVVVDTTAPTDLPDVTLPAGLTTENTLTVDLDGLAAGDGWQYSLDGGQTWTTGDATGTFTLPDGTYAAGAIQVRLVDAAGNAGPIAQTDAEVTMQTPLPPLTLDRIIDNVGNRVGNLADGDTTDDTRLALTGTGEAGQIVQIYDGDTLLGTATVADNGYWLFHTGWLEDGEQYAFRAKYADDTDGAGYTDSYAIMVDAPYPLAPTTAKFGGNSVGSYKNQYALAALKDNGSVVTWGRPDYGGNSTAVASKLTSGVVQVFSTERAFAALKDNGSVVTWGDATYGGNGSTAFAAQLTSGVVQVFSTWGAFAALKADGSVVAWGSATHGGSSTPVAAQLTSGVVQVFGTSNAFAALKDDGSVVTWGASTAVAAQLTSGIVQVFSNKYAFAALKDDGSVVTWGYPGYGGNSAAVAEQLASGVVQVFSTNSAFAALKDDGSVVIWGDADHGGTNNTRVDLSSGVVQVFSTVWAFAAVKADGSVVTWGNASYGGTNNTRVDLSSGVVQIFSTDYAFAALKDDGSVVTWGHAGGGGNSGAVAAQLTSGVVQVFSTGDAFAALKADGSVVTWGNASDGGSSASVRPQLTSGVVQVFSTGSAFAALKDDGSVVIWGDAFHGGRNNTNADLTGIATISDPRGDTTFTFGTSLDAPTLTLAEDTGSDPADGITAGATLLVSGLKDGATWEYSVDNGATWQAGTGTSFELPDGTYEAGQVQVRQTLNGKTSPVGSHDAPVVVDTTAPTALPDVTLPSGLTTENTLTVDLDGLDDGDGWQYSLDGGQTWTTGDATGTFTLPDGTYAAGAIQVRLVDAAGNAGPIAQTDAEVTMQTPLPPLTLDRIIDNVGNRVGHLADGDTTDDTRLALTGTGEAGQIVQIYDGDTLLGTATVADNGYWLFHTPWLDDGQQYAFRAKYAIDADGAGYTDSYAITVDAPYPLAPTTAKFKGDSIGSYKNLYAFAALKDDGSVVTWGNATWGGNSTAVAAQLTSGVVQVFSSIRAFAAVKADGSVVTWGHVNAGGDSTPVATQLTSGVVQVSSTREAFAALKDDGSVVTWGNAGGGGNSATMAVQLTSGVVQVFSNDSAFAALKKDGSVVSWGDTANGGNSSSVAGLDGGVVQVFSNGAAFAALKDDGSVVTWGHAGYGGNSTPVAEQLTSGVVQVFSNNDAFAALKDDGSVVTWGGAGGNSTAVAEQLTSGVVQVFSTGNAFAALKADGSVVTWGNATNGGNSTAVAAQLTSGVVQVFSNNGAFAALKDDGSLVTWGSANYGGNSGAVAAQLASGVEQVFGTRDAFAALKADGSVVTWGGNGGNSTAVAAQLASGVVQVFSNNSAFAALKEDGSVVTWGVAGDGGDSANADLTGIATISDPRGDTTFTFGTSLDAPTLTLAEDTGSDPADGITADATLLVSGLKDGATWEYSVDNGATWQAGAGTSFELPDGTYEAGQVQVRQTLNGKTSPVGSHDAPVVVDTTAPTDLPDVTLPAGGLTTENTLTVDLDGLAAGDGWQYSLDGGQTWTTGDATGSFTLPDGTYPAGAIQVRLVDAAGNAGASASTSAAVTIDTTPPSAPAGVTLPAGGLTNENTITVDLDGLEDDATWQYSLDGGQTWVTGNGTSFTVPDGSYPAGTIQVRQVDAAGNAGASVSTSAAVTIDTVPPVAPTLTSPALTNQATPVISGTAEAGSTVVVTVGDAAYTVLADADGGWSVDLAVASPDAGTGPRALDTNGENPVSIIATDAAGNTSTVAEHTLVIDTTSPVAPAGVGLPAGGLTNEGSITVDLDGLEDNATWQYSLDGGQTWITGNGDRFTVPDGEYDAGAIQVRQIDAAGNVGASASTSAAVTVDTTAPEAPTGVTLPAGGLTNENTVTLDLDGLEDDATWQYSLDGGQTWVTGNGTSFTVPDGSYPAGTIQVRQVDAAGNAGASVSTSAVVTIDTTPPSAPTGITLPAGGLTNAGSITVDLDGLEDNATWQYSLDGGQTWETGNGDRFTVPDGEYDAGAIQVRQIDAAGNAGASASTSAAVTIDTTPPVAPADVTLPVGGATNENTVTLDLDGLEDDATWQYSLDGGQTWVTGNGTSFTLPDGSYPAGTIQVRQVDAAGNAGASVSTSAVVTIDTVPPVAPTGVTLPAGGLTNEGSITVDLGGLEDDATWQYSLDGGQTWVTGNGTSFTLPDGSYPAGTIQVRQVDAAGNAGASVSTSAVVTIDTVPPVAPTLTSPVLTNQATPVISGTAEAGSTVLVTVGDAAYTVLADADGGWSVDLAGASPDAGTGPLALDTNGENPVSIIATDAAGNTSTVAEHTLVIDTTSPVAPAGVGLPAGGLTNEGSITVDLDGLEDNATWQYSLDGGQTWETGNGDRFTVPDGEYPAGAIQVRQVDAAGNAGASVGTGQAVTIDTTPPVAPAGVTLPAGGATRDNTITVDLDALEDDATWQYSLDGGQTWVTGDGDRFTVPDGSYPAGTIQVRQVDAAGNAGASASTSAVVTIDTMAPAAPTITTPDLTSASRPVISGTAEAGSTVVVTVGDAAYTVLADADGGWSVDLAGALPDAGTGPLALDTNGENPVSVTATDPAGNTSTAGGQNLVIDTTPPGAPAGVGLPAGGLTNAGSITVDLDDLEDDATWEYSLDGGQTWETGNGDRFTVPDGSYPAGAIQVRQVDAAGNAGEPVGTGQAVTIDTVAPAAPTITTPDLTPASRPVISGTAEAGSTVVVTVGDAAYTVLADADGGWSVDLAAALPDAGTGPLALDVNGENPVSVTATDPAGNTSTAGGQTLVIDTTPPGAPAGVGLPAGGLTNAGSITVDLGGLEDGATWQYSLDGGQTWVTGNGDSFTVPDGSYPAGAIQVRQVDAAGNAGEPVGTGQAVTIDTTPPVAPAGVALPAGGATRDNIITVDLDALEDDATWQYSLDGGQTWVTGDGDRFTVPDGSYPAGTIQVRQVDAAGNAGASASTSAAVTIDTVPPVAPTLTSPVLTNQVTPVISGTAEAGSTVVVTVGDAAYTVLADADGNWSVDLAGASPDAGTGPLALDVNGENPVSIIATDAAGNTSTVAEHTLVIDTTPPTAQPDVTLPDGGLTNEATITVDLDGLDEGDGWQYSLDGGQTWETGDATGSFTLPDGNYPAGAIQVRPIDAAGNTGIPVSNGQPVIIDATPPVAPTITSDAITSHAMPELTGAAEAGSTVVVSVGEATYTVQADADGNWSVDLATATPDAGTGPLDLDTDGEHTIRVTATDAAGNTSSAAGQTLVIDTTAPAAPAITSPALTNASLPVISGIAEAGSTVAVTLGQASYTVQADADGAWSVDLATATPDAGTGPLALIENGSNAVSVTATDAAGNISTAAAQTLVIDTIPPTAQPEVTLPEGGLINDGTIRVDLDGLDAGDGWQYSVDGGQTWTTGAATGTVTLPDGQYPAGAIQVRPIDAAGNPGTPVSNGQAVVIDTTPPAAPLLSFASDASTWVVSVANLEPGATWQYQINGGDWVTGQGESFTLPLGTYPAGALQVRQIDAAGNLGAALGSDALTPPATDLDGDGLDDNIENGVPGMDGGQQGDGNGDGIPDAEQPDVTSLPWTQTPDGQVRYVTLVNDAGLVQRAVSTAPIDATTLPEALTLPLGTLAFTVRDLPESGIVTFSVFIDDDVPVNGYWKQVDGQWINIATAIEAVGGKIRIDFQIEDGGRFDADGVRNGVIVDPGAPGWFDGDPLDTDGDQVPDLLEWGLGLTPGVKDNDVFARDDLFVMQVYRDALGREADAGGLDYWVDGLGGGLTREAFLTQIWASDEALATEPLAHLAVGLLARAPETAEWAAWRDGLAQGQTTAALANAFVLAHYDQAADAAFIDQLYADALSREADAGGRDYWLTQLAEGSTRGDVALAFVQTGEAVQAQGWDLDVNLLYTGLLGRGADAQGLAYWSEALADGAAIAQVAIGIVGSTEYHDRFLPSQEDTTGG